MINYQNGKIYKLVCNTTGLVYFGSTCEPTLARRLAGHTKDYKRGIKISSTKIIENGNYGIFLVETYPCNSRDELNMRERFYIENNECVNKMIPIRTKEEKTLRIKEYNAKHHPLFYEKNKEKISEYHRQHNKKEEVKVKLREAVRRWAAKNKDKIRDYNQRDDVKVKQREADKRYRDKKRVNEFFLNFLQCFNA